MIESDAALHSDNFETLEYRWKEQLQLNSLLSTFGNVLQIKYTAKAKLLKIIGIYFQET